MENKDYGSQYIKNNMSKQNGLNRIQRMSYIEREHLIELKKKLTEKVFRDLSNKYYNLLHDKNYNIDTFFKDFEKEMEKSYDFNNPDYKIFFRKIENIFLNKMNKMENKNIFNDNDIFEKEEIKSNKSKSNKNLKNLENENKNEHQFRKTFTNYNENVNDNYNQALIRDQIKMLYTPKKDELKRKYEEDEWAKIVNKDYFKFIEENETQKLKIKIMKLEYSKKLQDQIKSKKDLKKSENEIDKKYYEEVFLKNLKEQEKNELAKTEQYRRKCLENKLESMKDSRGEKIKNNN